ncbi:hypothetical protein MIND_01246300 [Mycena indigotica]|uniref:Uncharacterized protein n=1 Tax=Mycena indigotica TaxID=2126181 RepID=A0A8H6S2U4_9AGAR|nr:uncharacterized protein MIND_01246300 [Mycena indigotica]KAF7292190.1 hypothetical protein MIND_01246300 [Mycena indigotica]
MCKIIGLQIPNVIRNTAHYIPHNRSTHPATITDNNSILQYDPEELPLRTHAEIVNQGREVESAASMAESDRLAKKYGVKGVPLLSYLGSISFPQSFPFDFMHLIWENLVKNLVLLWTGSFKGLDAGSGKYELGEAVWAAIGKRTTNAGSTIPSAYGSRVPDITDNRGLIFAEM